VPVGMLGNKVGMTQVFMDDGDANPVTIIKVGPCIVTQIKTVSNDGYDALQLGYHEVPSRKCTKPEIGHLSKINLPALKYLKEYSVDNVEDYQLGQKIDVQVFNEGEFVDVTGKSIGKGFAGNQKRHHFTRGPMSHGSKNHRAPGSIGQGTTPGRIYRGKKMAGHMGAAKVTMKKIKDSKSRHKAEFTHIKRFCSRKTGKFIKH